jgi:hypothetical protein
MDTFQSESTERYIAAFIERTRKALPTSPVSSMVGHDVMTALDVNANNASASAVAVSTQA